MGLAALGATAALGIGLLGGGAEAKAADNPLAGFDLGQITELLDNELLQNYITICDSPDGSTPVPDPENPPVAVADCSQSTGTGIAVVLPDSIEVGDAAEDMTVDVPLFGERNLIEIVSAAAIDPWGGAINPLALGRYKSYAAVQGDAALPRDIATADTCVKSNGERYAPRPFLGCLLDTRVRSGADFNRDRREEALKVAEYLTGQRYDYSVPTTLTGVGQAQGSSTVTGSGIGLALSMTGGTALAQTGHEFSVATAGAGGGRYSNAYSMIGMANALNADTDQIRLTWFGQEIDFSRLRESGLLGVAGDEAGEMIDMVEGLEIPGLKEVSCYGVNTMATAEGLGSCINVLGTFDFYQDLRAPEVGESRQVQYGLTDITSLVLGNDALLKQISGTSQSTPFMDSLLHNLTSEDGRLKFAKDFVRLTMDVKTVGTQVQATDDEGAPLFDDDGAPIMVEGTSTVTAAFLTSDYGLRNPVTIDWLGYRVVLFPAVEVNGEMRPNYLGAPQISRIVDEADRGLLPKISLVEIDAPFGLGTVTLDKPLDLGHTIGNWRETVTLPDDIAGAGDLIGSLTGSDADDSTPADDVDMQFSTDNEVQARLADTAPVTEDDADNGLDDDSDTGSDDEQTPTPTPAVEDEPASEDEESTTTGDGEESSTQTEEPQEADAA